MSAHARCCSWRTSEVRPLSEPQPEEKEVAELIYDLTPWTQYAIYVQTYTIATSDRGAISSIVYFRTKPDGRGRLALFVWENPSGSPKFVLEEINFIHSPFCRYKQKEMKEKQKTMSFLSAPPPPPAKSRFPAGHVDEVLVLLCCSADAAAERAGEPVEVGRAAREMGRAQQTERQRDALLRVLAAAAAES